jgi:hypothetical protein
MPLAEEKALEILTELIKKPETKAEDIPRIWNEILDVYNKAYAPAPEVPAKKKRRRSTNPNIGWPAGVSRQDYNAWKKGQEDAGVTENLNPQEFKRLRDAGLISLPKAEAKAAVPAKPKAEPAKAAAKPPAKAAPKAKAGAKK